MRIIADSGSTKTDWRVILQSGEMHSFKTVGLNPFYISESEIIVVLNDAFGSIDKKAVRQIFFYGAGCANEEKCISVKLALTKVFNLATVHVESDMIGTARALFHKKPGIAVILGTGSNTCKYDGEKIIQNVPSLGYILGDEGSGASLGKKLVSGYSRNELPEPIHADFHKKFNVSYAEILEFIYKKPFPNRWLASFAVFLKENIHEPFIHNLVRKCFVEFYENQLCKYENLLKSEIGFSGSIAFHFSSVLYEIANERGLNIVRIIDGPIDELARFHDEM